MKKYFVFILALMVSALSFGQFVLNPNEQVKLDPNVRVGKLDNGLTYYIRHNAVPENRADFYIATNVGAINETPAQRGLAHFLEHMCFNGNKDFPGNTMLPYLEKNGLTFGGNINAMTGVEQTIYTLYDVPTQRRELVDTALVILQNDAFFVTNDFNEIEKERGVIIEEWRSGNTVQRRQQEQLFKVLFKGSKYADCNVIGDEECLLSFDPQELVNFYKTWYYPGNQAIVVVGDIDVDYIENKIKELFSIIPKKENPPVKENIEIPENKEPLVCVYSDPEMYMAQTYVINKRAAMPEELKSTGAGMINDLLNSLISSMLNERLSDASKAPDAKFTQAMFSVATNLNKSTEGSMLISIPKDNNSGLEAMKAAIAIVRQAGQYGFTQAEYDRAKSEILRSYQSAVDSKETRRNGQYAMEYVNHFLENEPYAEPEYVKEVVEQYLQIVGLDIINNSIIQSGGLLSTENCVLFYTAPEKEGVTIPTEEAVLSAFNEAMTESVAAFESNEVNEPLIDESKIKAGKIKKSKKGYLGSTILTLSNGVNVYLYPTDVRKDRVSIDLLQKGGSSTISEELLPVLEDNIRSSYASSVGLSKFTQSQLDKILSGKIAYAGNTIGQYTSGVSGSSSTKDLETLFQLVYLRFTEPRCEDEEFDNAMAQIKAVVGQLDNNPQFIFTKMVQSTLSNNHPRSLIINKELVEKANAADVRKINSTLFGDAVGAQVFITGDFDIEEVKPLIEKYIASLPVKSKKAKTPALYEVTPKSGIVDVIESYPMQNPNVYTAFVYSGKGEYNVANNLILGAYGYIMRMRYIESLREDDGGTYTPSAQASFDDRFFGNYKFIVSYQTQLEKADALKQKVYDEVERIANEGPTDEELLKTKEMYKKSIQENQKELSYWEGLIQSYYLWDYNREITEEMVENTITKENIQKMAQTIRDGGNRINITLNPQK